MFVKQKYGKKLMCIIYNEHLKVLVMDIKLFNNPHTTGYVESIFHFCCYK